tara:strand:- start:5329 stop:5478 length:150 start_codon:yes stop_codon:yes gene_type:complete
MAKKNKYSPKLTAEEYYKLTGQRIGRLTGQGTGTVTNSNVERIIIGVRG